MNIRLFSVALLASVIPLSVSAGSSVVPLDKSDFISAERHARNGDSIVSVKLSKSGKAKLRKLRVRRDL